METLSRLSVAGLTALWLFHSAVAAEDVQPQAAPQTEPSAQEQAQQNLFPAAQIEQLVAPIALYPDALIAQILMASTYPLDVVQAARWLKGHKDLEGEALEKEAAQESWDPSIKALLFFPSVLGYMNENLDWTQDLGDAVLGQQDDVMDAVQRLRREAEAAGNLKTTEQQRVATEGDTIVVQPADPKVVYVPSYNPSTVYGQTAPPATTYYPATYTTPVYAAPATESSTDSLVSFGLGALAGGLLTAAIMWDDDDDDRLYYGGPGYWGQSGYWNSPNYWDGDWRRPENLNINREINREVNVGDVNINKGIVGNEINRNEIKKWEHNPERRGGVRYRNEGTKQKFSNVRKENKIDRDIARGRDPARNREQLANLQRPGGGQAERPGLADKKRANMGEIKRPETRKAKRPETKKPETRKIKRPDTRQAKRPEVKKPRSRPANLKAPTRRAGRSASSKIQKPAARSGGRSSAFKVQKGGADRAASKRGVASRGGGSRGGGARKHGRRRG